MSALTRDALKELRFVLSQAEQMGCNCASAEQMNIGHNSDCPANQRNSMFRNARKVLRRAEKLKR